MTLSNAELTRHETMGPIKEYVQRLTITPLDTVWIADQEGSIKKRLVGYTDNHNTGVRRLDVIALPGEYIMITRRKSRDVIDHVSRQVFKVGQKAVFEANYEPNMVFKKVDLSDSYYSELNTRLLNIVLGEENLVLQQVIHRNMTFSVTDGVKSNIFQTHVGYCTDGKTIKNVKPSEWEDISAKENDDAVYIFVPFVNTAIVRVLIRDVNKQNEWMTLLAKRLKQEGFIISSQKGEHDYTFFGIGILLLEHLIREQMLNVK